MRLFPKKFSPPAGTTSSRQAFHLARAIARCQLRVALLLSERFGRLPLRARKACFLGFCLLLGSASGWILVQAVRPDAGAGPDPCIGAGKVDTRLPPVHTPSCQTAPDSLAHADM